MNKYKLLIISNNCLSQHNSNGRTLLNLLNNFKRENIFQIYTSGEYTDDTYCAASYRVTNSDVLKFYTEKKREEQKKDERIIYNSHKKNKINLKKNATSMLIRDLMWDWNKRLKKNIIEWAKDKQPDVLILQLGDSTHLIQIALAIVGALNIPLITYNTEEYYFKNYDYMKKSFDPGIIYKIFHKRFCKVFRNMMSLNPTCIYNCKGLRDLYKKEFGNLGHIIYCSTDFETVNVVKKEYKIIYAGNLGLGRYRSLIEVGKSLQRINSKFCIDVYSKIDENIEKILEKADGICYHGFVSYDKVCDEIKKSSLLLHIESFDTFSKIDAKYAFSTKLADYLKSGVPMFIYAPCDGEGVSYLKENSSAFIAETTESLQASLQEALFNNQKRKNVIQNALALSSVNHNAKKNSVYFEHIVDDVIKRKNKL